MLVKKKSSDLKSFITGRKKKNRFSKTWKPELVRFEKGSVRSEKWWEKYRNKIDTLVKRGKRRSYLSRTEKRKEIGVRAIRAATITIGLLLAVSISIKPAMLLLQSIEFFKVAGIKITGCSMTKPADIKAVAGYGFNSSMFSHSPGEVRDRIEQYPWVNSARVERIWPDEIHIQIEEDEASAIMVVGEQGREKMVYIDSKGNHIAPVMPGDDVDYPFVTGLNAASQEERNTALKDAAVFMRLIERNNPNLPAQSVSEIHFDTLEGMVVRLVDFPFPIYFGSGDVKKKYRQLRSILSVLYKKRKAKVDISDIQYIRMDYSADKVLVAKTNSG